MGKVAPVSSKYVVRATLHAEGLVEKPDIIGAIFGQTEGLLGADMELRELQKSGRIGRIEVETDIIDGKTVAKIIIPSSLDKTQTAIIAAALETIERIGPCDGKIIIDDIEDARITKRSYISQRAQEILQKFVSNGMVDTTELTDQVKTSVRTASVVEYGPEKLAAGPDVDSSEELILVEGRADVVNLVKNGINNVIATDGTKVPKTIAELMKKKVITAFVDGDHGGDLIVKSLMHVGKVDFVAKAPDGKEVEELTFKEILISLRAKEKTFFPKEPAKAPQRTVKVDKSIKTTFKKLLNELSGSKEAYVINSKMQVLGRIPLKELKSLNGLGDVYAVILDGPVNFDVARIAEINKANYVIGTANECKRRVRVKILTKDDL